MIDRAGRPLALYTDVVDTDPTRGIELLEQAGVTAGVIGSADPDVIVREAKEASALLLGYSPVTESMLDALPQLRVVATQSVGTDIVDLEACRRRGIWVTNVVGVATEEVASHALALALGLVRGVPALDRQVRDGVWDGTTLPLRRLSQLTVGVVGLGRIGSAFAAMVRPLVAHVVGHDPAGDVDGVENCSVDEVFARADLVSLHLPATPATRNLVDERRLALMRPGSMLVNVSRGELLEESAVLAALDSGHLAGAGLDVLVEEPPASAHPLVSHPRVIVTPHAAYLSEATMDAYVEVQAQSVAAVLTGNRPANVVVEGSDLVGHVG